MTGTYEVKYPHVYDVEPIRCGVCKRHMPDPEVVRLNKGREEYFHTRCWEKINEPMRRGVG